ncbi:DUF3604 domain-containing protein [Pedosphaera parvula]|uniref:DUF3604 domain-containing protein n=1 Tax=Pedosphaera parvula (strain Ellin514) TaxID=320771 RepID=B9XL50_PEDPL|nr:DUF3604 domain-containing protein [Pedosphaera parvula]EEF59401.1 hypothetical protein Cflav_PD2245 [Pedosphaera parvula Ellin514]
MMKRGFLFCFFLLIALSLRAQKLQEPFFLYDPADQKIPATMLENELFYDAGVASTPDGLWLAWLELQPGKGDVLWVGCRKPDGSWSQKIRLNTEPGDFANPTPVIDAKGELWVSYEAARDGDWDVFVQQLKKDGSFAAPIRVSPGAGADINHRVVADAKEGLWFVWQGDHDGQFDIFARHVTSHDQQEPIRISDSPLGDWAPALTITKSGDVHIVWDSYDGESYNVLARTLHGNEIGRIVTVADGPAFQAHAQIAAEPSGRLWALWEEDGENWGKAYRARTPGEKDSTLITDQLGPLHRFRRLRLAELDSKSLAVIRTIEIPMPSLEAAAKRPEARAGFRYTGAFYEGGQLTIDPKGRLWITYRHFYTPWIGIVPEHHKQDSSLLYARCLTGDNWSKLYSFEVGQGDSLQRFSAVPGQDGIATVWTTGRTDRRKSEKPHGVAIANIHLEAGTSAIPVSSVKIEQASSPHSKPAKHIRPSTELAGKGYELFTGDLHRHTDISLCFAPSDGSIDDAYRYAIDAAPLDFLGITDHTHDLAMGNPLSLIWWRSRKEVNRHQLIDRFVPFYSYERSRVDTDHNVISLRDDMLRPHTYPLTQFWTELDTNTFTIAHQPFNRILWNYKDDVHRPLMEIYQGFRNDAKEKDAKEGLLRGHKFGIIASSDHLSTDASFACVWAEKPTRESIFRAMQARRTFGATAHIKLKVFAGEHWMGESFSTNSMSPIKVEVKGTAPISSVDLLVDGDLKKSLPGNAAEGTFSFEPDGTLTGSHIFYVRLQQADGNRAWASPFWVEIKP